MMKLFLIIALYTIFHSLSSFAQDRDTIKTEEAPVPINLTEVMKQVVYPEDARIDEIEGKVYIKLLVDENGDVEKTGSINGPEVFYIEVKRVAMNLKFTPAKINGYSFKCWVTVPFNFQMK